MIKRRWIPTVVLAAVCWASEEPPIFHVNTQLVEVDVVVRGKNRPVTGLTKNDFTILDNGKPQQIAVFSVRSSGGKDSARLTPLAPGVVSNRLTRSGEEPASPTVILWDALNTETSDQAWVRNQVIQYLRNAHPGDPIAVYILVRNLRIIQDFTDDSAPLIMALSRTNAEQSADLSAPDLTDLQGQIANPMMVAPGSNGQSLAALQTFAVTAAAEMTDYALRDQVYITQAALESIAEHLSGLPGRKKLVWISGSFPGITVNQRSRNGAPLTEVLDFSQQIDHAIRALNGANVAVYPMDPRGVATGAKPASATRALTPFPTTAEQAAAPAQAGALSPASLTAPGIDTMQLLAGGTGGQAAYATNDVIGAMKAVMEDGEVAYRLGFYPTDERLDGSYHSLSVKVARKGQSIDDVRSRKGYFAIDAKNSNNGRWRDRLNETMLNPLEATQLGLRASAIPVTGSPGIYQMSLTLDLDGLHLERAADGRWVAAIALGTLFGPSESSKGSLETIRISLTEAKLRAALQNGYELRRKVVAGPAKGELHVVVEDAATGALGSVRVPLGGQ